jgi:hypothetical protein
VREWPCRDSVDFYLPPLGVVSPFLFTTGKLEQKSVSQFLFLDYDFTYSRRPHDEL